MLAGPHALNALPCKFCPTRRRFIGTAGALSLGTGALGTSALAQAQSAWPNRPVTFVVPFPSGGGTDAFAHPLSVQLTRLFGKQVIIDNRGGAGATIASKAAPTASPSS